MRQSARAEGPPAIVYAACAVTFSLGLFFIFVWTPLPWGWHGIDFYYENALALARGESFGTTKITWPLEVPCPVTPLSYRSVVPVTGLTLMSNGCPEALTWKM